MMGTGQPEVVNLYNCMTAILPELSRYVILLGLGYSQKPQSQALD